MYHRLCLNLFTRSAYTFNAYRASSGIRFQFNRLNHVASENGNGNQPKEETISSRFADYKIIYTFPYIKYASKINIIKRQFTFFFGAATPVTICLQLTNILSFDIAIGFLMNGIIFTLWLHIIAICCNNLVGYVYLKQDESKIILSHVNYWGKRIDLKTTIDDIIPITDNQFSVTDLLFKKIMFSSKRKNLKINIKYGQITDDNFNYIFGTS